MSALKSLVLITVDCLRADHVSFLGYNRRTTPFLESLAAESVIFSTAIVAGAPTYYSFPGIMASRYPLALGRDVIGLAPHEPTIASVLNQSGYSSAAFVAGNPYLSPRFGYGAGFGDFQDFLNTDSALPSSGSNQVTKIRRTRWNQALAAACHKFGPAAFLYNELYFQYCQRLTSRTASSLDRLRRFPSADVIIDQACQWLSGHAGQPFFLWLHFMDPHWPYYPPLPALASMGNSDVSAFRARYVNSNWNRGDLGVTRLKRRRDQVIALYDSGIHWVDVQIGRLVNKLRDLCVWDNCVFALTADHGEEFLDHGGRYHSPSKVTDELIRVPLLIRAGEVKAQLVNTPFSLLDLAPTLLDAMDAPIPGSFRGNSCWSQVRDEKRWDGQAIVECITSCSNPFRLNDRLGARILAIREKRYKLVFDFGISTEQLFDLEADPHELHPVAHGVASPARRRLLEVARQHLTDSLNSRDLNQRLTARLRDLRLEWAESTAGVPI
jgi:arylsulfatase A-like enzyme